MGDAHLAVSMRHPHARVVDVHAGDGAQVHATRARADPDRRGEGRVSPHVCVHALEHAGSVPLLLIQMGGQGEQHIHLSTVAPRKSFPPFF
jgi:hypothetical protein